MRRKKGIRFAAVMAAVLVALTALPQAAFAAVQTTQEMQADALKSLGLFEGTAAGYQLHRKPTRMEAVTMLIHLLGEDSAAKAGGWKHPFADVPDWAQNYAGYAYNKGLSSGVSAAGFGSDRDCTEAEYLTFVLRALGYDDRRGDFAWDSPYALAKRVGLINTETPLRRFSRGDMVSISYKALTAPLSSDTSIAVVDSLGYNYGVLKDKLIEKGAFTAAQYISATEVYAQGPKTVKAVYLTFDDGPSAKVTPRILAALEENGVPATFFVLGNMTEKNPQLVRQEYEEGHKVATHGYSHDYKYLYASADNLLSDIKKGNAAIDMALGFPYDNRVFRFPGGSYGRSKAFPEAVKNAGYTYYDWNASGEDATKKKGSTAKEIAASAAATSKGKQGDLIVLFHDAATKSTTADALPEIIKYYRDQGYVFRTLE
ncbi:polysaccharide deacetylase family protein [Bacilliculturomica massiliensis]|uniref:polysaccharide deacetylase family protein n=1 Tax=Bacilliculturomica massiliensis TaxID=1917867 RepID=UPI00102F9DC9|nr:polysaccharide deacetylase family protein [Bacilliculturomica massiliensis]